MLPNSRDEGKSSRYESANVVTSGTNYLRSLIRTNLYKGDALIEERLARYQLYWQFYRNKHWRHDNDKLLSFNYCRALIDKVNNFMVGKDGFSTNIVDLFGESVPEDLEKAIEAAITYNYRMNGGTKKIQEILQMTSICGDGYVFLAYDTVKMCVKITTLESREVIPIFNKGDYSDIIGYRLLRALGDNDQGYRLKITEYYKEKTLSFYLKETGADAVKFEQREDINSLGFIPIVHFENQVMSDTFGGASDLQDILKLNKVYNEMAEDIKGIIDYYGEPTTIITGATLGNVKRGIGQIWSGLPAGSTEIGRASCRERV